VRPGKRGLGLALLAPQRGCLQLALAQQRAQPRGLIHATRGPDLAAPGEPYQMRELVAQGHLRRRLARQATSQLDQRHRVLAGAVVGGGQISVDLSHLGPPALQLAGQPGGVDHQLGVGGPGEAVGLIAG